MVTKTASPGGNGSFQSLSFTLLSMDMIIDIRVHKGLEMGIYVARIQMLVDISI